MNVLRSITGRALLQASILLLVACQRVPERQEQATVQEQPATPEPTPSTDQKTQSFGDFTEDFIGGERNYSIITDRVSGCQYIDTKQDAITPRLDSDGKPICREQYRNNATNKSSN